MVDRYQFPTKMTPQAVIATTTAAWDNGADVTIPIGTVYVVVYGTENFHCVATSSATTYADAIGTVYAKEQTHIIELGSLCANAVAYLHHNGLTANANLYWTAFGNA